MYLKRIKLTNFRNYSSVEARLAPGINVILGENGAGKTSTLEAINFCLQGGSFRTSRDSDMVRRQQKFFRLEAEVETAGVHTERRIAYEPGAGVKVNAGGGSQWFPPGAVITFSPDQIQLIKGPPAARRRFLDDTIVKRSQSGRQLVLDYAKVLSQRNSFLQRAKAGLAQLVDITPWDRQLAQLALKIYSLRKAGLIELSPLFGAAYREISGEAAGALLGYRSQIEEFEDADDPEAAIMSALAESWQRDMERLSTSVGTHRDDMEPLLNEKDLRFYGSQGEQRMAMLALLFACREVWIRSGAPSPLLLLDDVMSELDPGHRRRLMILINNGLPDRGESGGQVVITAADRDLFTGEELSGAAVLEIQDSSILQIWTVKGG